MTAQKPATIWQQWEITPATFFLSWCGLTLIWAAIVWALQPSWPLAAAHGMGGAICLAASIIDWRSHILPDALTIHGGFLTLIACAVADMWPEFNIAGLAESWIMPTSGALTGFILVKGLQRALRHKHGGQEQLGSGDAKLMLPLGAMVGPLGVLPLAIIACLMVALLAIIRRTARIPFGPALTTAGLLVIVTDLHWP
jgi:prepilin signal peptidase PulO-like enzyme (type II secretory pathway)